MKRNTTEKRKSAVYARPESQDCVHLPPTVQCSAVEMTRLPDQQLALQSWWVVAAGTQACDMGVRRETILMVNELTIKKTVN